MFPRGNLDVVISSLLIIKDLYNVHCFVFEWRKMMQVVEHGNDMTTMRHGLEDK
jgi:hypothetical protein